MSDAAVSELQAIEDEAERESVWLCRLRRTGAAD